MSFTRLFHCGCCAPPRQIYYRAEGRIDVPHHEDDHSAAVAPVSLAERKRMLRD